MKKLFVVSIIVFVTLFSVGCDIGFQESVDDVPVVEQKLDVEWLELNPPPGVEGPCWSYFVEDYHQGFSGVYCLH